MADERTAPARCGSWMAHPDDPLVVVAAGAPEGQTIAEVRDDRDAAEIASLPARRAFYDSWTERAEASLSELEGDRELGDGM